MTVSLLSLFVCLVVRSLFQAFRLEMYAQLQHHTVRKHGSLI